jgi:hypothetical protein
MVFVRISGGEEHVTLCAAFVVFGDVAAVVYTGGAVESFIATKCSVQFIFGVGGIDVWRCDVRAVQFKGGVTALAMSGYSWHE